MAAGQAGSSAASRWSVRDLGSTAASSERGTGSGGGVSGRGDDWRDRAAASATSAAGKRRWDASGDRRLNGGRYSERDRERGRDERYGSEAVPAWFTGDANAIASSLHDGQWKMADEDALEPAALPTAAQPLQQPRDEEATRFLFDKLGISPLTEADDDGGLSGSLADTRPAWAVQAERELAEHRATWSSQQKHKQQQRHGGGYEDEDGQQTAGSSDRAASDGSLDDGGLSDVSPEDAARAAALAAAMASESEYDKLDAMLAERAKQQTDIAEAATEGQSDEAKQLSEAREEDRQPTAQRTQRRGERTTADTVQEFIIPAQSESKQHSQHKPH